MALICNEGIFRIIQSIPSKKAEPVKQWLAEVGSKRIDQMIDPELAFQRQSNPQTLEESKQIAQEGGDVARDARETMEKRLGRSVISHEKASDYIKPIENDEDNALPQ